VLVEVGVEECAHTDGRIRAVLSRIQVSSGRVTKSCGIAEGRRIYGSVQREWADAERRAHADRT
jgi:hypothetical protein